MRFRVFILALVAACASSGNDFSIDVDNGGGSGRCIPSRMPVTLTPASPPAFPASLTAPVDGDACSAASNNGPDQAMLDGITAARMMLGGMAYKPKLRSVNGSSIVMGAVPAMMLTVGGAWTVKGPIATQTFVVGDLEAGGAYLASTRYYMYLYLVAGVVTRQITTTAPDANNKYKSTSTDFVYVGSFATTDSGEIVAFSARDGVYTIHSTALSLAGGFTGTGPTTYNLGTGLLMPASSTLAILSVRRTYNNTNATIITLTFGPLDGSASFGYWINHPLPHKVKDGAGNTAYIEDPGVPFRVETDSLQRVTFTSTDGTYSGPSGAGNLNLEGYVEH